MVMVAILLDIWCNDVGVVEVDWRWKCHLKTSI